MNNMSKKITGNKASDAMIERATKEKITTVWDRFLAQGHQCGFGQLGLCCTVCNMGPCRAKGSQLGVCGADADIISSRNMTRAVAVGAASHADHARDLAHTLLLVGEEKTKDYMIRNPEKLRRIAREYGIDLSTKDNIQVARELGKKMLSEFGQQEGEPTFPKRAPKKQQEIWRKLNIFPRGVDREVTETLCRTHEGMDNDYQNLIRSAMKVSLADGWVGSMMATEVSDILFGAPYPIRSKVNLGVIKKDEVNILIHGHEPTLSDQIVSVVQDSQMLELAKKVGAQGITVAGICCTANENLMRRGVPVAGNFLQQELAVLTGAVEAMVVDIQCIMPGTAQVAKNFHTKVISTSPKARFMEVEHVEFKEERAGEIAREIVKKAIENFPHRDKKRVEIPEESLDLVAGFTTENIFHHLGGKFRSSYRPLNDNIINGRIRGIAGVVGCDNPKNQSGASHTQMVKELIKHDVLVVQTGCAAIACARDGLLVPEAAAKYAGRGLQEVCAAVGIPPVLHNGACVDNSRVLIECCEILKEGGLGEGIDDLPVAGAAPEWMSEKAMAIGWYFVTSGALVVFGSPLRVLGSKNVTKYITEDMEKVTGGKWAFEDNPIKAAHIMIEHIDKKRAALKLKPMIYESAEKITV
jgi:carbon-monoxide dehydrogenase catalytic subunit